LCWIAVGGGDALHYFERCPGRFPLVHAKDAHIQTLRQLVRQDHGTDSPPQGITEVGHGEVDWTSIFAQSEKAGIKHVFVEHDWATSPYESLRVSYEYLRDVRW
jgi:sugar phosphate isomerase/epimerase